MGKHVLLSVYVAVVIISLLDRVVGPCLTENSRTSLHPAKDKGEEQATSFDTNPNPDDLTNSDKPRDTPGSIPDPAFTTPNVEHNTTVDKEDVGLAPKFPNRTLDEIDSANLSPMEHDVSLINELQMENQENLQLPFLTDRISNTSVCWNHTFYDGENDNYNCSMIKNMTIFTLGRKMPLYIDILSLVIGAIGIVGNLATIIIVAINLKLRKPYFLTILTLAVGDLLSVSLMMGTMFLEFDLPMYIQCIRPVFYTVISAYLAVQLNSVLQVVLIAVVKFLLLVYPIKSRTYVTNNLIVALFFGILSVSACFCFLIGYLVMQRVKANEDASLIIIGNLTTIIILSNLVIILLHFIKVAKLKKSQALKKETQKMNQVVSIILVIYIVHNCHKIINNIILRLTQNIELSQILDTSITILAFIHHACNPLIYAAFTPLVQKPLQRLKDKFIKR